MPRMPPGPADRAVDFFAARCDDVKSFPRVHPRGRALDDANRLRFAPLKVPLDRARAIAVPHQKTKSNRWGR